MPTFGAVGAVDEHPPAAARKPIADVNLVQEREPFAEPPARLERHDRASIGGATATRSLARTKPAASIAATEPATPQVTRVRIPLARRRHTGDAPRGRHQTSDPAAKISQPAVYHGLTGTRPKQPQEAAPPRALYSETQAKAEKQQTAANHVGRGNSPERSQRPKNNSNSTTPIRNQRDSSRPVPTPAPWQAGGPSGLPQRAESRPARTAGRRSRSAMREKSARTTGAADRHFSAARIAACVFRGGAGTRFLPKGHKDRWASAASAFRVESPPIGDTGTSRGQHNAHLGPLKKRKRCLLIGTPNADCSTAGDPVKHLREIFPPIAGPGGGCGRAIRPTAVPSPSPNGWSFRVALTPGHRPKVGRSRRERGTYVIALNRGLQKS